MQIGDAIATVATPIARALKLPCVDPATGQLRPESTCAKVKQDLNEHRFVDAFKDRFFLKTDSETNTTKETKMNYVITVIVGIDGASPVEAFKQLASALDGKAKVLSVGGINPMPDPSAAQAMPQPKIATAPK